MLRLYTGAHDLWVDKIMVEWHASDVPLHFLDSLLIFLHIM